MTLTETSFEQLCINTIRGLAIDAVQKANSGHPGLPLGTAAMGYTLWTRHLRHHPKNPKWWNRDRFILSAGHGSMLLYSLLHLTGYDLPLEELKAFRQFGSMTPGHPENTHTPGVEMATGPLGQGFATAVGMALAERFLAATFNRKGYELVDHYTYVLCSDGDLMEGVAQEAASLAGHFKLGKLIVLYDDNHITIDGSTEQAFTENTTKKFEALNWQVLKVDGNDVEAIDHALTLAKSHQEQPTLIHCHTTIGYGSPNKAGTPKVHGSPLGSEETLLTKKALGLPEDQTFWVDPEVLKFYRQAIPKGESLERQSERGLNEYQVSFPAEGTLFNQLIQGDFGTSWIGKLPVFAQPIATRNASQSILNLIAAELPTFVGGSADLAESVMTAIKKDSFMQAASPKEKNIAFGVREHAMAALVNGMTLHGGCKAFGGTFLIFSDYCRPSLRLAALMKCPSIFLFSHDSIGLGEDGPTHQPVEHLMSLRAIPNFNLLRPADGNETSVCWRLALESKETPSAIILSRQALPPVTPDGLEDHPALKGAYTLKEASSGAPEVILVATGSEVHLALEASIELEKKNIPTRVVSMPSWLIFEKQSSEYQRGVLPQYVFTVSVEAGVTLGWSKYADAHIGIDHFGASAPGNVLMEKFGFTAEHITSVVLDLIEEKR